MCALREKRDQNHQVRKREEPLVRINPRGFCRASDESQVTAFGEIVQVLDTNPRQSGDFRISENFLARLHGNHGLAPGTTQLLRYYN